MKYYMIAGEASGDLHGSNLIKELLHLTPSALINCWGGQKMADAGAVVVKNYKDLAFMGFTEVIANLGTILKNFKFCKKDILHFKPDVLILIDYPGFNLRLAKWAYANKIPVVYYISPQIWALKENRIHDIKKYVGKMLVILPFEKSFYKKWNYNVEYVGHPLVKVIDDFNLAHPDNEEMYHLTGNDAPIIALLPGSRKQEILKNLPVMLRVANEFTGYSFIVAKAPGVEDKFYEPLLSGHKNVFAVAGKTYQMLSVAKAAIVTSGTATLETALFFVPQIICYKGSALSVYIAKKLIKIKYIGLVNLITDKEVVKELIQNELTEFNLEKELRSILTDSEKKLHIQADYNSLRKMLSGGGDASKNAAKIIADYTASI